MNRIYQGRVVGMELMDSKKGEVLKVYTQNELDELLWRHHELFQEAVNYHSVCLMAMAGDEESDLLKIRKRIGGEDEQHNVWRPFARRGQKRQGMREVAKYFGLSPETATMEDCCREALAGNTEKPELLDLALKELLHWCGGDGQIQQEGRSMLPRFCKADYKGGWNTGATVDEKNAGEKRLREELAEILDAADCERFAAEVQMSWVVNISQRGEKKTGEESRKRLLASVAHFGQYFGTHRAKTKTNPRTAEYLARREHFQGQLADIEERLKAMEADQLPEIPPNERSIPDRLEALLDVAHQPARLAQLLRHR